MLMKSIVCICKSWVKHTHKHQGVYHVLVLLGFKCMADRLWPVKLQGQYELCLFPLERSCTNLPSCGKVLHPSRLYRWQAAEVKKTLQTRMVSPAVNIGEGWWLPTVANYSVHGPETAGLACLNHGQESETPGEAGFLMFGVGGIWVIEASMWLGRV